MIPSISRSDVSHIHGIAGNGRRQQYVCLLVVHINREPSAHRTDSIQCRNDKVPPNDGDESIAHLLVCFFASGDIVKMGERFDFNEKHRAFPFANDVYGCKINGAWGYGSLVLRNDLKMLCVRKDVGQKSIVWAIVFGFIGRKAVNEVKLFSNGIGPSHNWVDLEYDIAKDLGEEHVT